MAQASIDPQIIEHVVSQGPEQQNGSNNEWVTYDTVTISVSASEAYVVDSIVTSAECREANGNGGDGIKTKISAERGPYNRGTQFYSAENNSVGNENNYTLRNAKNSGINEYIMGPCDMVIEFQHRSEYNYTDSFFRNAQGVVTLRQISV